MYLAKAWEERTRAVSGPSRVSGWKSGGRDSVQNRWTRCYLYNVVGGDWFSETLREQFTLLEDEFMARTWGKMKVTRRSEQLEKSGKIINEREREVAWA